MENSQRGGSFARFLARGERVIILGLALAAGMDKVEVTIYAEENSFRRHVRS